MDLGSALEFKIGALDQPPQHGHEVWRLIEGMSTEDLRAFSVQCVDGLMHLWCGFPHLADSFADEQEVLGIDVACLYEVTGLLGTPAGVRVVYQSAQGKGKGSRLNLQHFSHGFYFPFKIAIN